tara:strand:- start:395 stop:1216 length:822 start_codon:yes stop_codon:yes gene_type:complete
MSNEIQKIENPMGVAPDHGVIGQESSAHAMAEVQAQVVMAKQFPRDSIKAVDNILNECTRPALAESSAYAYPRGGQRITGPSIRLAEAVARHWGNLEFGIKELDQKNGESSVIAFCWDLENNVRESKTFKVRHIRNTRNGDKKLTDSRDIYELVANQGARRLRACILGVIPGDVIEAAEKQCAITLNASADLSKEGIQKLLKAFEKFEVTKEHIEKNIGCHIKSINAAQVVNLRSIYNSLNDGMSKNYDWFDIERPKEKEANFKKAEDINVEG